MPRDETDAGGGDVPREGPDESGESPREVGASTGKRTACIAGTVTWLPLE